MTQRAGVGAGRVEAVATWQTADYFCERERVALKLTASMLTGHVKDPVQPGLAQHFSDQEWVELVATAGCLRWSPASSTLCADRSRSPVPSPKS